MPCLLKEMADSMLAFLYDDVVTNVMQLGLPSKQSLCQFSMKFLADTPEIRGHDPSEASFSHVMATQAMKPFLKMTESIANLCKSLLHFFCEDPPAKCGIGPTSDEDCLSFSNYTGGRPLEKCMRRVFISEGSWWASELEDMIRKGATTHLSKDKLDQIDELLQNPQPNYAWLSSTHRLVDELKSQVRSQKLSKILEMFSDSRCIIKFVCLAVWHLDSGLSK